MSSVATPRKHTATKADVALRNLSADLSYLSTPHTSDEVLPSHIQDAVSDFAHEMPRNNPFMAAILSVKLPALPRLSPFCFRTPVTDEVSPIDFAQLAARDAIKKDAVLMLQVLHTELKGTPEFEAKIDALKHAGSDTLLADARAIVTGLQRNIINSAYKTFVAMHKQCNDGLWSRTASTEENLTQNFIQGKNALGHALTLFDSGHVQEAITAYTQVLQRERGAIDDFSSAIDTDFYLKFGTGTGILIGAGFAAAYTGGGTLYAITGSATATEATGIGAYAMSLLAGGAAFTVTEKFLNHHVFNIPYFTTGDPIESTLEFAQSSLKMSTLMGYMNSYTQIVKLPTYVGTGATAINFSANFANEFVGLTSFTVMTEGTSQALDPTSMTHGLATLLGLKAGNFMVAKSVRTVSDTSGAMAIKFRGVPNATPSTSTVTNPLLGKPEITIVVTDSGMGGVSVAADIERRVQISPFQKVRIVYFNALPAWSDQGQTGYKGYNQMETMDMKAAVFDLAIRKMQDLYHPDIIAIACNTLSVVYPETKFARDNTITTPVVNIVHSGVTLMYQALTSTPGSKVVIMGTPTTIHSGRYQSALVELGIAPNRIIAEPCPDLAAAIEQDPARAKSLIDQHVANIMSAVGVGTPLELSVSLSCTHYGYVEDMIRAAFAQYGVQPKFLNPNPSMMTGYLDFGNASTQPTTIQIEVVSQFPMDKQVGPSFIDLIARYSPAAAQAMRNYTYEPNLFDWTGLVWPDGQRR